MFHPNKHKSISIVLPAILLLAGCTSDTVYHSYQPTAAEGWDRKDTLYFDIPENIQNGHYALEIGIRHTPNYAFQNIWLSVSNNWSDSLHFKTDTIELKLADESGKWLYRGHISNLHQSVHPYSSAPDLPRQQTRTLKIVHIMRSNPLKGIQDVGVRLAHE